MSVYWEWPDIMMSVVGGSLIALSSTANLYLMGRITGLSGMVFTVSRMKVSEGLVWKVSFLIGMLGMSYLMYIVVGESLPFDGYDYYIFDPNSAGTRGLGLIGWSLGSFFVGVGTKLGSGCTSGHGVCGLPRFSLRSFVAVGLFMSSGIAIATLRYYVPFFDEETDFGEKYFMIFQIASSTVVCLLLAVFLGIAGFCLVKRQGIEKLDPLLSFGTGSVFGLGLCLSGMCRRTKILAFLTLKEGWDPSLMFVMGAALCVNVPVFWHISKKTKRPLLAIRYEVPTKKSLDWPIFVGPVIFGLGWGLCGFCPAPGLVNVFILDHGLIFLGLLLTGQLAIHFLVSCFTHRVGKVCPYTDNN